jgi:serine/threonine protein phosphatase PrpC
MGNPLSSPIHSKVLARKGNDFIKVGIASMQGWRQFMEDTYCHKLKFSKFPRASFFAVYDGHGDSTVAEYLRDHLVEEVDKLKNIHDKNLLTKAVTKLDKKLQELYPDSGSTALFCIVDKSNKEYLLTVGHIGNSSALLFSKDSDKLGVSVLTKSHTPVLKKETDRIRRSGGEIQNDRVNGTLMLSRAFGDGAYKIPKTFSPEFQMVSSIPDLTAEVVIPGDYLLLVTDGVFENNVFTKESITEYLDQKLKKNDDLAYIMGELLDECIMRGSKDNVTAILIQFENGTSYHQQYDEFIPGPYPDVGKEDNVKAFKEAYQKNAQREGYDLNEALFLYKNKYKPYFDTLYSHYPDFLSNLPDIPEQDVYIDPILKPLSVLNSKTPPPSRSPESSEDKSKKQKHTRSEAKDCYPPSPSGSPESSDDKPKKQKHTHTLTSKSKDRYRPSASGSPESSEDKPKKHKHPREVRQVSSEGTHHFKTSKGLHESSPTRTKSKAGPEDLGRSKSHDSINLEKTKSIPTKSGRLVTSIPIKIPKKNRRFIKYFLTRR